MSVTYDSESFYDGLVAHRLIVPSGVQGVFARGPVFEDVLSRFDALVGTIGADDRAEAFTFPPILPRRVIEATDYLDSFPQLAGTVFSFQGNERQAKVLSAKARAGEPWAELQDITDVCLCPAACYPLYPTLSGTLPEGGRTVTLLGWVFRHEPSQEPTRMQSFRMREYIRIGVPDEVVEWRDRWLQRGLDLLRSLGLPAESDVAADPFFGRGGRMLADGQKQQKLKFEVQVPVISSEAPTACCSFNYHMERFAKLFGIHTPDGQTAHTACLGFGLERCTMALFRHHGYLPAEWPAEVRARLWP